MCVGVCLGALESAHNESAVSGTVAMKPMNTTLPPDLVLKEKGPNTPNICKRSSFKGACAHSASQYTA